MLNQESPTIQRNLILLSAFIPALISLYFIFIMGVNGIYWDSWFVTFPQIIPMFTDGVFPFNSLFDQSNDSLAPFTHLIVYTIAYITNYNSFYDSITAWIILGIGAIFLWLLILKTIPNQKWVIIPIIWLLYSLSSYHSLIYGSSGIAWFSSLTAFLGSIYFIEKTKESQFFIVPAMVLGFVSTFSYITGVLVWPIFFIGLLNFKFRKVKMIAILIISSTITYSLYLYYWTKPHLPLSTSSISDPTMLIHYVFSYLGHGIGKTGFIDYFTLATSLGAIIVLLFLIMIIFSFKFKLKQITLPWIQLSLMGLSTAILTSIARGSILGIEQSLSSRYVIFAHIFLIGVLVLTIIVLTYQIENNKSIWRRKASRLAIIFVIILLGSYIISSYTSGWYFGSNFSQRIDTGTTCLVNYHFSSEACLKKISNHPYQTVIQHAKVLEELNLGPFNDPTFVKFDDIRTFNIMLQYPYRSDLQEKFPEAKNNDFTKITDWINSNMDNIPSNISNISNHNFGYLEKINDQNVLKNNTSIITSKNSTVTLTGWALSDDKGPIDFVYVYIDGNPFSLAEYGQSRMDVVKKYGIHAYQFGGYHAKLSVENLQVGCHAIDIILFHDSELSKISNNNTICLNDEISNPEN